MSHLKSHIPTRGFYFNTFFMRFECSKLNMRFECSKLNTGIFCSFKIRSANMSDLQKKNCLKQRVTNKILTT